MAKNSTQFTLIGDKELIDAFGDLARRARSSIVSKALRAASRPIVNAARDNIRAQQSDNPYRSYGKQPGNLRKSMGLRIKTYRNSGTTIAVVGPRWPQGAHGHLIEFGTTERLTKGEGKVPAGVSRGFMPARPFLRPAFDVFKGQALAILARLVRNGLIARRFAGD